MPGDLHAFLYRAHVGPGKIRYARIKYKVIVAENGALLRKGRARRHAPGEEASAADRLVRAASAFGRKMLLEIEAKREARIVRDVIEIMFMYIESRSRATIAMSSEIIWVLDNTVCIDDQHVQLVVDDGIHMRSRSAKDFEYIDKAAYLNFGVVTRLPLFE